MSCIWFAASRNTSSESSVGLGDARFSSKDFCIGDALFRISSGIRGGEFRPRSSYLGYKGAADPLPSLLRSGGEEEPLAGDGDRVRGAYSYS